MSSPIRAFLFDMDGLLLDTELIHIRAYMKLTEELHCAQDFNSIKRFIGHSHHVVARFMREDLGCTQPAAELIAREQKLYFDILHSERPEPLPGVREWFDLCDKLALKRALVSSSVENQVAPTMQIMTGHLKRGGTWREHFHSVCTGDRVRRLKPAPDLYLLAIEELELSPQDCVAFEDSPAGVSAAHEAGCRVVAVPNMYLTPEEVTQGKAHHVYRTLAEAFADSQQILN